MVLDLMACFCVCLSWARLIVPTWYIVCDFFILLLSDRPLPVNLLENSFISSEWEEELLAQGRIGGGLNLTCCER